MKKFLFILFGFIFPAIGFAFFCPTNFNQIQIGDTLEQVQQACGQPDKQDEKEVEAEGPQEWSYFVAQNVAINAMQQVQGTLKTTFSFDANGKAINISVNGIGVGATTICGNNLQLGDTKETVKATCGQPSFINKQSTSTEKKSSKVTEFTYNTNPPVKLIFENGRLLQKK